MPEPIRPLHPIDPALISAYYDDALEPAQRVVVEEHLERCGLCRAQLAAYRWLGTLMQADQGAPAPVRLDRRVMALARGESERGRQLRLLARPVWAAVAVAGLAALVTLAFFPLGGAGGPSVAAAYPCENPADCAVAVRFEGSIDRDSVERSVQLDPPVPVAVAWRGDTLLVKPAEPLRPTTSYTLSLKPQGSDAAATPVAVHFVAGSAASPVAMDIKRPATTAQPVALLTSATSTAAPPTPSAIACRIQLAREFGNLYRSQPVAISRLGCARVAEFGVDAVTEPFRAGRLLWRGDRREIMALLSSGTWQSYPDTFDGTEAATPAAGEPTRGFGKLWRERDDLRAALGPALEPQQSGRAVIQEFERGLLMRTADQMIYALYSDRSWARYADTVLDATATVSPTPVATTAVTSTVVITGTITPTATLTLAVSVTPTVTVTTTSTPAPTVSVTPTATVPSTSSAVGCSLQPVRGLGLVYRDRPGVATRLGCARTVEVLMTIVSQTFERGNMLWRSDQREIAVLRAAGSWSVYPDTWRDGETPGDLGAPPSGRTAPRRSFGKLWRQQPTVRDSLGWGTAEEQSQSGAIQEFANGWMLQTGDNVIYVLYSNGSWQSFPNTFAEPTSTPTAVRARG